MFEKTEPQQQPWTSGGISRSRLMRLGLGGFPPMNGSTDALCQTGMAFFFSAHAVMAAVAS